jgi:Acetyltransferase (GNAT) domain
MGVRILQMWEEPWGGVVGEPSLDLIRGIRLPAFSFETLDAARPYDSKLWDAMVDEAPLGDVYYRPGYVRAFESLERTRALALVVTIEGNRYLIPLLIRTNLRSKNITFNDGISPYGYGGLLQLDGATTPCHQTMHLLFSAITTWCLQAKMVACFLRLHPLTAQHGWFDEENFDPNHLYVLKKRGATAAVDLSAWDPKAKIIRGTSKGRASDLSFARKHLRVTRGSESSGDPEQHLHLFYQIYTERMNELRADTFYLFPEAHFDSLRNGLKEKLEVFVAWLGSEPVGASMFFFDKNWAHYHLSGTTKAGQDHKASTILLNAGAEWAWQNGCKLMHLGGGLAPDDGLARFKQSLGGRLFEYHTLLLIADGAEYDQIRRAPHAPWPY